MIINYSGLKIGAEHCILKKFFHACPWVYNDGITFFHNRANEILELKVSEGSNLLQTEKLFEELEDVLM